MTEEQALAGIKGYIVAIGPHETLKRLKRTAPQGSIQRHCSGESGAAPDEDANKLSSSASPFGGQGKGEQQRLVDHLRREAAMIREHGTISLSMDSDNTEENRAKLAADFDGWVALVLAVCREPRPQSDDEGDESHPCPKCGCDDFWFSRTEPMGYFCESCGWGESDERSVPPNASVEASPTKTMNKQETPEGDCPPTDCSLPLDVEDFLLKCGVFLDKDGGWVPEDRRDEIRSRLHRMAGRILDRYSTENAQGHRPDDNKTT